MKTANSIKLHYRKTRSKLFDTASVDFDYWARRGLIPLGSKLPPDFYDGEIPEDQIIFLKFDKFNKKMTERKAFNILVLGGSGDGKSLMIKNIWTALHYGKYHIVYIDPKSTDSGRAREPWNISKYGDRLAPKVPVGGINLIHCLPVWASKNYKHMVHNFKTYSIKLKDLDEVEMWQGLGMRYLGASKITRLIENFRPQTIRELFEIVNSLFKMTDTKEITAQTRDNVLRTLTELEDFKVIDEDTDDLDLWAEWIKKKEPTSVCISYNRGSTKFMTFDIGLLIKKCAGYYFQKSESELKPVFFIFDDASFYANDFSSSHGIKFNYALQQITYVGNNYRSLGLNNLLAVQTLGIIDEDVSQTYRVKLISPAFQDIDNLSKIKIPQDVINVLKDNILVQDREKFTSCWIKVNEDNSWETYFPFNPPCNHFEEVYSERRGVYEN